MTLNSQRLVSFFVLIVVGVIMALTGGRVVLGTDLSTTLLALAVPFTLLFANLTSLFSFMDAEIATGKLQAGDIVGMLSTKEWWISMVLSIAGLGQIFGFKVISEAEQIILVNVALAAITVLLQSFTTRTPTSPITVAETVRIQALGKSYSSSSGTG